MKRIFAFIAILTILLVFSVPVLAAGNNTCPTGTGGTSFWDFLSAMLQKESIPKNASLPGTSAAICPYTGYSSPDCAAAGCPYGGNCAPDCNGGFYSVSNFYDILCSVLGYSANTLPQKPIVPTSPVVIVPPVAAPATPAVPAVTLKPVANEEALAGEVVRIVNEERAKAGLPALTLAADVQSAAMVRASELPALFSHTRPDGASCFTALDSLRVNYWGAGENIAAGQLSPDAVMKDWMNSDGHRANILNGQYTKIGVGCFKDANGRLYWSQFFIY